MQIYTDPSRESDPYALPDAEVFQVFANISGRIGVDDNPDIEESGWYWVSCSPGCLPDGKPVGPFDTEDDAIFNAQDLGD